MTLLMFPKKLEELGFETEKVGGEYTLILPKPHSVKQNYVMNFEFETLVATCGTKWGKTFAATIRPLRESFSADPAQAKKFRIIAPVYQQALLSYDYMKRLIPNKIGYQSDFSDEEQEAMRTTWEDNAPDKVDTKKLITWAHNGAIIQAMSGDNADTIEGDRIHGNIMDEAAKVKESVYAAMLSTTSHTRGWNAFISTPTKGKNHFYRQWREAYESMIHDLKMGRQPKSIALKLPTWANPYIDKEFIERKRKQLPKRLFDMFYGAEFVDGSSVFGNIEECLMNTLWTDLQERIIDHDSKMIFVGVDFAKQVDYTVFYVLNEKGQNIGYKRIHGRLYSIQIAQLWTFCRDLLDRNSNTNSSVEVLYDKTGVGVAIEEPLEASNKFANLTGITWNNSNKNEAVYKLVTAFEHKDLKLLPWESLKNELEMFESKDTSTGRETFSASGGAHDDIIMALMQANLLRQEYINNFYDVISLPNVNPYISNHIFGDEDVD